MVVNLFLWEEKPMKTLLRCFAAIAVTMMLVSGASAELVAEWNYNAASSPGNASTGTGTTSGSFFPFTSSLPDQSGSQADTNQVEIFDPNGISLGFNNANGQRSSPAPGEASATRLYGVNTSTAGFTDISVTWDFLGGFRTSRYYQIFATSDGATFNPVSGGVGTGSVEAGVGSATVDSSGLITVNIDDGLIPPNADTPTDYLLDLSYSFPNGSAFENNPDFGFRIAAIHAPGGADYVSSFAGTTGADPNSGFTNSTSAGGGTIRYDLIRVTGIPEPTALALAACGLAYAGLRRRRK